MTETPPFNPPRKQGGEEEFPVSLSRKQGGEEAPPINGSLESAGTGPAATESPQPFSWKTVTATVVAVLAITLIVSLVAEYGNAGELERVAGEAIFVIGALVGGFKLLDYMGKRGSGK